MVIQKKLQIGLNQNLYNMRREVDKLHLIYIIVISILFVIFLIICWVISCKQQISDVALQNFSFAATITSIVLAVVSIVYSIYSGAGMSGSVSLMQDAENKIRIQVDKLDNIDTKIFDAVRTGNSVLENKVDHIKQQIQPISESLYKIDNSDTSAKSNTIIDINKMSVYGLILLYICYKSLQTGKSWPIDLLGNENKYYFQGLLVVLTCISELKFEYNTSDDFSNVKMISVDSSKLNLDEIYERMHKRSGEDQPFYNDTIKVIDEHFSKK